MGREAQWVKGPNGSRGTIKNELSLARILLATACPGSPALWAGSFTIAKAPYPAVTGSVGINTKCLRISTEKLGGIHLLKITLPPKIRVYHFSDFSSNENATGKMQNQHSGKHSRQIIFGGLWISRMESNI